MASAIDTCDSALVSAVAGGATPSVDLLIAGAMPSVDLLEASACQSARSFVSFRRLSEVQHRRQFLVEQSLLIGPVT